MGKNPVAQYFFLHFIALTPPPRLLVKVTKPPSITHSTAFIQLNTRDSQFKSYKRKC